jgi:hypothetical protein
MTRTALDPLLRGCRVLVGGGVAGLVAVVLVSGAAAVTAGPRDAVYSTPSRVTALAADGRRVAVVTSRTKRACGRIVVWTPPSRRATSFKPGYLGCSGDGVSDVALGGGQVAWIEQGGGNDLELTVMVAKLGGGAVRQIDYVVNGDRAGGDPSGGWVGQLLGGGPLLAYNRWTVVCDLPSGSLCGDGQSQDSHLANQQLVRIVARRTITVASGASSYRLSAVGGGRMAVEAGGVVTVLAPSGERVATVPAVEGDAPRSIRIDTTSLAVRRTSTLDLYDAQSGTARTSLRLRSDDAGLQVAGVSSKLALLRGRHRLVLVRLQDGAERSLPLRSKGIVGAELTAAGVFYAYNVPRAARAGRVVFVPTAKLLARF